MAQFWFKMQLNEIAGVAPGINPHDGATLVIEVFSCPWMVLLYLVWFFALWFHLTHGFWSAMQTVGINNKIWFNRWKTIGNVYVTILCLGFAFVAIAIYIKYGLMGAGGVC
jgi:succinate dehydrogenase / fumarate reductase cytochrome b subunit